MRDMITRYKMCCNLRAGSFARNLGGQAMTCEPARGMRRGKDVQSKKYMDNRDDLPNQDSSKLRSLSPNGGF